MTKNLFDGDDKIVQDVIKIFQMRSAEGMKNYGMKMEENPKSALAWAIDAQEELMDAILYIQCLKENFVQIARAEVRHIMKRATVAKTDC
mgnify:CR=1 FL=1